MKRQLTRTSSLVILPVSLLSLMTLESASAQGTRALDEIVVTASRRAELLQDVPTSITAITDETIDNLGITSFGDYASLVPGLSQRDGGRPSSGTIILRGLNTGPQQTTNTTAYYMDETPFSASGFLSLGALITPEPGLADVERIEVLKGPQGTLYGASSLGGLIRLVTKKPNSQHFEGAVRVDGTVIDGGGNGYGMQGSLNVPIVTDVFALRVNGFHRSAPGFTDNVGTGTRNVNTSDSTGAKLAARLTPRSDLTFDFSAYYHEIESRGFAFQDNVPGTVEPLYGERQYRHFEDLLGSVKYRVLNGTGEYELARGTVIGSLSHSRIRTRFDSDATPAYGPLLAPFVPPDTVVRGDFSPNMDKLSAELRFISDRIGPMEFMLGSFYTDEESAYRANLFMENPPGTRLPAPFDVAVRTTTASDFREWAGYGNLTYYFSEQFDLTGGLRYARNDQDASTGGPDSIVFFGPNPWTFYSFKGSALTYLATARWRPTDNINTYLRAASGYRPGGPQTNPAPPPGVPTVISEDSVRNYEAGIKATFLSNMLRLNAAVFRIDWTDIHLNSTFGGLVLQSNGGDAKVDGLEADLLFQPQQNLTFQGNIGHTNARITRVEPGVQQAIGVEQGDKLPLTPQWTAAALVDHSVPVSARTDAFWGATLRYQSDMPSGYPGAPLDPNVQLSSITTLDLRAGLEWDRYRLQFLVQNVFDRNGYSSLANSRILPGQDVPSVATVIRPRGFTLSFSAGF
ncbi:MAG: TonB-dependent receptor [Gammaproteobacteria bacterium]|nr:TonB-dependent receptor [Gammaproteobacteria bacterium]